MFGILNLNKPAGWTSRDAVNRVQRLVKPAKVGHAGTLDPLATGVLVVCIGPATRLIEYLQQTPKHYRGEFRLGVTSPSDDTELELTPLDNPPVPTFEAIERALPDFVGEIQQRPPIYSAVKVKGLKAYKRARAGEELELPARPVTIHAIDIVRYDYPQLVLDIRCGSGTYIRSLGRDLAASLGTAAVMSGLERTAVGDFRIDEAIDPDGLTATDIEQHLQPATRALGEMPTATLTASEQTEIRNGRYIERQIVGEQVAAIDQSGQLVALLRRRGVGVWGPKMVFANR